MHVPIFPGEYWADQILVSRLYLEDQPQITFYIYKKQK